MKKIYIMRHGETLQSPIDWERRLSDQGKKYLVTIKNNIIKQDVKFDLALVSPAPRAKETFDCLEIQPASRAKEIIFDENIYKKANFRFINEYLLNLDEKFESVFWLGHNPSVSEFVGYWTQRPKLFSPGELVEISGVKKWSELASDPDSLKLKIVQDWKALEFDQ